MSRQSPPAQSSDPKKSGLEELDDSMGSLMRTIFRWLLIVLIIAVVVGGPLFYIFCLNHVSLNHVGIAYNSSDGTVTVQQPGWHRTSPFVRVANISTLPLVVRIPSEARLVNQRLVKFNPDGAIEYVKEQGFSWITEQEFQSIMLGYAYSGKEFAFLDILEKNDGSGSLTKKP
jgi:hypothetical protein